MGRVHKIICATTLLVAMIGAAYASGTKPIKWVALPYALSVGTPVWDIKANGKVSRASMKAIGYVNFEGGYVSEGTVILTLVSIGKYDQSHRITCKYAVTDWVEASLERNIGDKGVTEFKKKFTITNNQFEFDTVIGSFPTVLTLSTGDQASAQFRECAVRTTPK
jgi:hypothetical protein